MQVYSNYLSVKNDTQTSVCLGYGWNNTFQLIATWRSQANATPPCLCRHDINLCCK